MTNKGKRFLNQNTGAFLKTGSGRPGQKKGIIDISFLP
jgi:hypothetical protein